MKIITKNVTTNRIGKVVFILITTMITLKVVEYSLSSFNAGMMYKTEIKNLIGDVANCLFESIEKGSVGKEELKRLASVTELNPIYKAYKDRDPFNASVARSLLSELLDKEGDSHSHFIIKKDSFSGMRRNSTTPRIQRSFF